jgi:hypothetical protein
MKLNLAHRLNSIMGWLSPAARAEKRRKYEAELEIAAREAGWQEGAPAENSPHRAENIAARDAAAQAVLERNAGLIPTAPAFTNTAKKPFIAPAPLRPSGSTGNANLDAALARPHTTGSVRDSKPAQTDLEILNGYRKCKTQEARQDYFEANAEQIRAAVPSLTTIVHMERGDDVATFRAHFGASVATIRMKDAARSAVRPSIAAKTGLTGKDLAAAAINENLQSN